MVILLSGVVSTAISDNESYHHEVLKPSSGSPYIPNSKTYGKSGHFLLARLNNLRKWSNRNRFSSAFIKSNSQNMWKL